MSATSRLHYHYIRLSSIRSTRAQRWRHTSDKPSAHRPAKATTYTHASYTTSAASDTRSGKPEGFTNTTPTLGRESRGSLQADSEQTERSLDVSPPSAGRAEHARQAGKGSIRNKLTVQLNEC